MGAIGFRPARPVVRRGGDAVALMAMGALAVVCGLAIWLGGDAPAVGASVGSVWPGDAIRRGLAGLTPLLWGAGLVLLGYDIRRDVVARALMLSGTAAAFGFIVVILLAA